MLISISVTPSYAWYSYVLKRKLSYGNAHKEYVLELNEGDIFGVRKAGRVFYLIVKDYTDIVFKLTTEEAEDLIKKCKGWSGKIDKKIVSAGIGGKDLRVRPSVAETKIKAPRTSGNSGENKELTATLKKLRIKGIADIKFLHKESFLPNEITYYYDITSLYNAYAISKRFDSKPKTWGDAIEEMIEKLISNLDVECGTVNYLGKPTKLMSVLVLE
jgi:hypothetical protein